MEIKLIIIKRGALSVKEGLWERDVFVNSNLNKLLWVLLDKKIMKERRKVIKNAETLIYLTSHCRLQKKNVTAVDTSLPRIHSHKQGTVMAWQRRLDTHIINVYILCIVFEPDWERSQWARTQFMILVCDKVLNTIHPSITRQDNVFKSEYKVGWYKVEYSLPAGWAKHSPEALFILPQMRFMSLQPCNVTWETSHAL